MASADPASNQLPLSDARATDIFFSYARVDENFVSSLSAALANHGKTFWVDRQSILPASEWLQEIHNGIRAAHTFVFVISPNSVASKNCFDELSLAVELNKRLVTVMCTRVPHSDLPEPLRPVQSIDLLSADFSEQSLQPLLSVIDKDLDWLRQNIRWDLRAKEWEHYVGDPGFLLSGVELKQAEEWMEKGATGVLHPSHLQIEYIQASRKATQERLSSELAEQAQRNLKGRQDLALLLSVEAHRSAETLQARRSLVTSLDSNPYLYAWLRTDETALTCVAFTPDGKFVAAGNKQGSIFIWDLATLQQRAVLRYFTSPATFSNVNALVESLSFSPDGQLIAAAFDNDIVLWSYRTGGQLAVIKGTATPVNGIAFSPDSKLLAWAANDGKVRILPLTSMTLNSDGSIAFPGVHGQLLEGHHDRVSGICFSPNGSVLASAGADIRFWDPASGGQIGEPLTLHTDRIPSLAFSPDGQLLASGSLDGTVILWDVSKREPSGKMLLHDFYGVTSVAFSPDGRKLASAARDASIALWDVAARTRLGRFEGHDGLALRIAFSPKVNLLASAGNDAAVILWDVTRYSPLRTDLLGHSECISAVGFSPDNQLMASGGWDGLIIISKLTQAPQTPVLLSHNQKITSFSFSFDSKLLVSGTFGWLVKLWDASSGELLADLSGHSGSVLGVKFSPVANMIASASADGSVILWDASSRQRIGEPIKQGAGSMLSVDFSHDGKLLAIGTESVGVLVLDIAKRELVCEPLTAHTKPVTSVVFHPSGNLLVSGSHDETIRFWNTRNWKPQGLPKRAFSLRVLDLAISSSGDHLASCHADGSVHLWDGGSGDHLAEFRSEYRSAVWCVRFHPDSKMLLAGICIQHEPWVCGEGAILCWDISSESWCQKACRMANRNFSGEEWERYFSETPYRKTCDTCP